MQRDHVGTVAARIDRLRQVLPGTFKSCARASPLALWIVIVGLGVVADGQTVGTVTTIAGGGGGTLSGHANGLGTSATFNGPEGVAISVDGTFALFVRRQL